MALVPIYHSTLGADAASFDVTSIPATFEHLYLVAQLRATDAAAQVAVHIRFNNDSGASKYDQQYQQAVDTTTTSDGTSAQTYGFFGGMPGAGASGDRASAMEVLIPRYAGTTFHKTFRGIGGRVIGTADSDLYVQDVTGHWRDTSAINRITIYPSANNFLAGSSLTIYGLTSVIPADLQISELDELTSLDGTEEFVVADSGTSKKITAENLGTAIGRAGYGTSLPGSPADGEEFILVDSTTDPSYQWRFRYNAGSSSAYEWEFIGGAPVVKEVATLETASGSAGAWQDLATTGPTFTLPYAGDWLFEWVASVATGGGGDYVAVGPAVGATTPLTFVEMALTTSTLSAALAGVFKSTGRSASDAIRLRYYCSGRTDNQFHKRRLFVTPIRVTT